MIQNVAIVFLFLGPHYSTPNTCGFFWTLSGPKARLQSSGDSHSSYSGPTHPCREENTISEVTYAPDDDLPTRSMHEHSANLTCSIGPVKLHYDTTFQSHDHLDLANQNRVPDNVIHNLTFEWENTFNGLSLLPEMRSTDANQIEDMTGHFLTGRLSCFSSDCQHSL